MTNLWHELIAPCSRSKALKSLDDALKNGARFRLKKQVYHLEKTDREVPSRDMRNVFGGQSSEPR